MTAIAESDAKPAVPSRLDAEARALARQYYLAMGSLFFIDQIFTLIYCIALQVPELYWMNLPAGVLVLLGGGLLAARRLFKPIQGFLCTGQGFESIQRNLTQLPLHSALWMFGLYLGLLAYRILLPRLLANESVLGLQSTWLDIALTIETQAVFGLVYTYLLVSSYLERLCRFAFEHYGHNLNLFFGRFTAKLGVLMYFISVGPLSLLAGEVFSYEGERLIREVVVDLVASAVGIGITLLWLSRTLVRPLHLLEQGMERVAGGDVNVRLPVTSNEEIGEVTAQFNRMMEGMREQAFLRDTFGKYVSASVAEAILRDHRPNSGALEGHLPGQTREATVMFTDIDGFTGLSEWLHPDLLIRVLNEYLEIVLEPIRRHGGVVNGFIGDGLFASFNLPLANENHAAAALAAAIDIEAALAGRTFAEGIAFSTRIGINTGTVIGGTIGAGERLTYTLLGDTVNVAARLQDLNKTQGTRVLAAHETVRQAGDDFVCRPLGDSSIRGKAGLVAIYSVEGRADRP